MAPLPKVLHQIIKLFVISTIDQLCICQCLRVIGNIMSSLFMSKTNCTVRDIHLDFEGMVKIRKVEDRGRIKSLLEVLELFFCQGHPCKCSVIGDVMKGFSKLREVSYKFVIKVNATQKNFELQGKMSRPLSMNLHFRRIRCTPSRSMINPR